MQKCSLCGGKVVNGRCEDCGMPIPEEHRYTLRSETVRTRETGGEKKARQGHRMPQPKPAYSNPTQRTGRSLGRPQQHPYSQGRQGPRKKALPGLLWWVIFLALGVNILAMMAGSFSRG